jgi:hypothetical protein
MRAGCGRKALGAYPAAECRRTAVELRGKRVSDRKRRARRGGLKAWKDAAHLGHEGLEVRGRATELGGQSAVEELWLHSARQYET